MRLMCEPSCDPGPEADSQLFVPGHGRSFPLLDLWEPSPHQFQLVWTPLLKDLARFGVVRRYMSGDVEEAIKHRDTRLPLSVGSIAVDEFGAAMRVSVGTAKVP